MKKLFFIFAFLFVAITSFSNPKRDQLETQVTTDNVKMYRQPGTSTELLRSLRTTDKVVFVRKHNSNWTIVKVGDQFGYVLTTELTKPQHAAIALTKSQK